MAMRGLTLIELLITMVIAAILVAYGVPALQTFVATNQLATGANDLVAALNLARSEAVRIAQPVGVCVDPPSSSWTVAPMNAGGACDPTSVIRRGALTGPTMSLDVQGSPFANLASFDSLGRLIVNGGNTTAAFVVCRGGTLAAGGQSTSRAVVVAQSGRVRVAATDTNGVPIGPDGVTQIAGC